MICIFFLNQCNCSTENFEIHAEVFFCYTFPMSFPWMLCVCTDYGNDLSVEDQIGNPIVESNHDS